MKPSIRLIIFFFGVAGIFAIFYFDVILHSEKITDFPSYLGIFAAGLWIIAIAHLMTRERLSPDPDPAAGQRYGNEAEIRDILQTALRADGFKKMKPFMEISQRAHWSFTGMILCGIAFITLFSFLGWESPKGAIIGAFVGMISGYFIGRRMDLKEVNK